MVDDSGREEAIDSGREVSVVSQVHFHEQTDALQKHPDRFIFVFYLRSLECLFLECLFPLSSFRV